MIFRSGVKFIKSVINYSKYKMETHIALLRGINVSGQKKIIMADLKVLFEQLGFHNIITYIQSGNVVFKSNKMVHYDLEEKIKQGISETFGFEVPVLVLTKKALEKITETNPFINEQEIEREKIYYVLLKESPDQLLANALQKETHSNEKFEITNTCVYLACLMGYGKSKCNNNFFEKKLKVSATTRNHKTIEKLLALASV